MTFDQLKEKAKKVTITSLYPYTPRISGRVLIGKCPLHKDAGAPNFRIYQETNSFFCFRGCGGGDVISFVMKWKDLDFKSAVKFLLNR